MIKNAIFVQNSNSPDNDTMYYVQKNYLGSYYSITDENGRIVLLHDREEQVFSFDPCSVKPGFREQNEPKTIVELIPNSEALREGRRRKPNTRDYYSLSFAKSSPPESKKTIPQIL